ncbi:hypothetical protein K438DRAFT_1756145 [Mycena galopus ATCC 62051]|nr:hypothetical protein K438DRAFT_1756145 [Mycena galopus ATCC 62051]
MVFEVMNLHEESHDSCCGEKIETFFREFIVSIIPELMHNSEPWGCLIMAACENCKPMMQDLAPKLTKLGLQHIGSPHDQDTTSFGTISRPDATRGGLSGACLTCRGEHTKSLDFPMLRCAQCKLVRQLALVNSDSCRYCRFVDNWAASAACQKKDWARHKKLQERESPASEKEIIIVFPAAKDSSRQSITALDS